MQHYARNPQQAGRIASSAPWYIIAFSLTFSLLSGTALILFSQEQKKAPIPDYPFTPHYEDPVQTQHSEEEINPQPIPINEIEQNNEPNTLPEIFNPNAVISERNETATGEDLQSVKGKEGFDQADNPFDIIGVGGGSGVGTRPPGSQHGGGIRNLMAPGSKNHQGSTPDTQSAVLNGLKWLARHQSPDGSWNPAQYFQVCHKEQ